jgi:hypothetical protein
MLPDDVPDSVLGCFASRKFRIKPMGKRGSAVTCGSPPRRRPYSADAASRHHRALPLKLIMKIGPLPDACQTPAGRTGTRLSLRQNAMDPGFHGVPACPAHLERAADGAGVTGVRYGAPVADRARPASRPLDVACAYRGARARCGAQANRPPVRLSDCAVRLCRPGHPPVPVSCRRGSAGC